MTDSQMDSGILDKTAAYLAYIVTILVALSMLTPYIWKIPEANINLITQGQTTLWNGWMLVLGLFFKSRGTSQADQATIATQADTIKQAQTTLSNITPSGGADTMALKPGETATATATNSGTNIIKEATPDALSTEPNRK